RPRRGDHRRAARRIGGSLQDAGSLFCRRNLMPPVVIQLQHVSKRYRAGRSRTFTEMIGSGVRRLVRPREDESVYSLTLGKRDANIWAVRDLDFEVERGAGLGII